MKAKKFDSGKNITAVLDLSKARRPLQEQKRVNVDFPTWMIEALDKEAPLATSRTAKGGRVGDRWLARAGDRQASVGLARGRPSAGSDRRAG